jgi:sortase A
MRRWLFLALVVVGTACILVYGVVSVSTWRNQREAKAEADRIIGTQPALNMPAGTSDVPIKSSSAPDALMPGQLIGRVEIPRLQLSAAVAEGDDDKTLGKAVGHLPDTPMPWERQGNVGLAAHRDGLFRALKGIRLNDDVRLVTIRGEFLYRVRKTHIVNPDDVWVLDPTERPTITLITCYPFQFVGNAPQRFIVQAELIDQLPGSPLTGAVVK